MIDAPTFEMARRNEYKRGFSAGMEAIRFQMLEPLQQIADASINPTEDNLRYIRDAALVLTQYLESTRR